MLDLRKDRLDYTADLFRPPDGFHFKRAVATTYSLDLKALLASLLPLVLGEEPDASALKNPLMIWRALKKAAGHIAVFHEEGQIINPHGVPDRLYALLEQMLVAVQLPADGRQSFPAFHPKTWAIEFQNDTGEIQVRFCVLSRNLTFDRSWDMALSLDGGTDARRKRGSAHLSDFFSFLRDSIPSRHAYRDGIRRLVGDVSRAFASRPLALGQYAEPWDDFEIVPLLGDLSLSDTAHPLHADALLGAKPIVTPVREAVVISPFLSKKVVRRLCKRIADPEGPSSALISRRDAFANLSPQDFGGIRTYAFKEAVIEGGFDQAPVADEDETSAFDEHPAYDIHAKMFFWRRKGESTLLVGSANATESALSRNVEMLVRLHAGNRLTGEKILADLFGRKEESSPFEEVFFDEWPETDQSVADARAKAEKDIKVFCRSNPRAEARSASNGLYTVSVYADGAGDGLSLAPYLMQKAKCERRVNGWRFSGMELHDVSSLYLVSATRFARSGKRAIKIFVERIVLIPTAGIPEKTRDAAIENELVTRAGGLANCLAVLFAEDPGLLARRLHQKTLEGGLPSRKVPSRLSPGLYEKMLRAVGNPAAFAGALVEAERLLAAGTAADNGLDGETRRRLNELLAVFHAATSRKRGAK